MLIVKKFFDDYPFSGLSIGELNKSNILLILMLRFRDSPKEYGRELYMYYMDHYINSVYYKPELDY